MSAVSVIHRFRACEGSIELLALEGKGALDLLQSNPLAGFCLAVNHELRPAPAVYPLTCAWRMVYQPQREIFAWLGFPGTEAVAKIGRKCVPESLTLGRCLRMRRVLADETMRPALAHLPRINAGVMALVTDEDLHAHSTPQLLAEVVATDTEDAEEACARMLADTRRMARLVRRKETLGKFHSWKRLREIHDELVRELNRRKITIGCASSFPPPPLAGRTTQSIVISPITDSEQLHRLGREQHNCVASYGQQIRSGRTHIYRVARGDEICTLALERTATGRWDIQQLKGICNREASAAVFRAVRAWLIAGQPVVSKRTVPVIRHGAPISANDFSPVPVGGVLTGDHPITPVNSLEVLTGLSLNAYRGQIAGGWAYAYQVHAPEGDCSAVIRRGNGRIWRLHRVLPAGENPVRGETLQAIADWLGRSQKLFR